MAYAADLTYLECSPGNRRCRTAQSRGNLHWRSRAKPEAIQEGVETRRAAPKLPQEEQGEGIVQTANLLQQGGESRGRYENPQGLTTRVGSTPTARTTPFNGTAIWSTLQA